MVKQILKWTGIVLVGLFVVAQLVPYGRDHSNPSVVKEPKWDSARTRDLVSRSCAACHSNLTKWPWYSNIAPVSWLTQHDVEEGRAVLNFSEWNRKNNPTDELVEEVESGNMPPLKFRIAHSEARLSSKEKKELITGLKATFGL